MDDPACQVAGSGRRGRGHAMSLSPVPEPD
jgi:hypothetical protein